MPIDSHTTIVLSAVCLAVAGCGSSETMATVSGSIQSGGQPLPAGTVLFEGNGIACVGSIDDGQYNLSFNGTSDVPPGSYRVSVLPPPVETIADPETTQLRSVSTVDESLFPAKYRAAETSDLRFEVVPGTNVFDLSL